MLFEICWSIAEEFVIIMRGTPISEAERVAERILESVREAPIVTGNLKINVTVSIGIAAFQAERPTPGSDLLAKADLLLYEAKQNGRNQIVSSPTDVGL